MTKKIKSIRS